MDRSVEIIDPDDVQFAGAEVCIVDSFDARHDFLHYLPAEAVVTSNGGETSKAARTDLRWSFDQLKGCLTFDSIASRVDYQKALRLVSFEFRSESLKDVTRSISFRMRDLSNTMSQPCVISGSIAKETKPPRWAFGLDVINILQNTSALGYKVSAENDKRAVRYVLVCDGYRGTVKLNNVTGEFDYTPRTPFVYGPDDFLVRAEDVENGLSSSVITIRINIINVLDAPVAESMHVDAFEDVLETIELPVKDFDGPAAEEIAYVKIVNETTDGNTLRLTPPPGTENALNRRSASLTVQYLASSKSIALQARADAFAYQAVDVDGLPSEVARVKITLHAKAETQSLPVALNSTITMLEDTTLEEHLPFEYNYTKHIIFRLIGSPTLGRVELLDERTGAFRYTPYADATGSDTIKFRITGVYGITSSIGTTTIVVEEEDDAPVGACALEGPNTLPYALAYNLSFGILPEPGAGTEAWAAVLDNDPSTSMTQYRNTLDSLERLWSEAALSASTMLSQPVPKSDAGAAYTAYNAARGSEMDSRADAVEALIFHPEQPRLLCDDGQEVATLHNTPMLLYLLAHDVDSAPGARLTYKIVRAPTQGGVTHPNGTALSEGSLTTSPWVVFTPAMDKSRGEAYTTLQWAAMDASGRASSTFTTNIKVLCQPGYKRVGLTCSACPLGRYNQPGVADQIMCVPCPEGTAGKTVGATSCSLCESGTYQNATGQPTCTRCPHGDMISPTASDSIYSCVCPRTFFRPPYNTDICLKCNLDRTACDVANQTYPKPYKGYWVNPKDGSEVVRCLLGGEQCAATSNVTRVALGMCAPDSDRDGGQYEGFACSRCRDGHFRVDGKCEKCPTIPLAGFSVGVIFLVVLPGLLLIFSQAEKTFPMLNLLVGYCQIQATFGLLEFDWGSMLTSWYMFLGIFNLNPEIIAPECMISGWDYSYQFVFRAGLPGFFLFVLATRAGTEMIYEKFSTKRKFQRGVRKSLALVRAANLAKKFSGDNQIAPAPGEAAPMSLLDRLKAQQVKEEETETEPEMQEEEK